MNQPVLSILIVDDEPNIRKTLSMFFETQGHRPVSVGNATDAITAAHERMFHLAFVDLRLGTDNGLDLIPRLLHDNPWLKVVVITAYASVDTAVKAMQSGAVDYIPKPFEPEQLTDLLRRLQTQKSMESRIQALQDDLTRTRPENLFASQSPAMQRIYELARRVAPSEATILLQGPSGTGKTALAKVIHQWSNRADKPFGVISCPSLSPDLLESDLFGHVKGAFTGAIRENPGKVAFCEGGTLFLDEIGELPPGLQVKLLRFIQEREYERVGDHQTRKSDVRIIAATNNDLEAAVKSGQFREDLYFRLSVIDFKLPALCNRREDILPLAATMLTFFGAQNHRVFNGFDPAVTKGFLDYPWPGNLRELRNVIERMAILCPNPTIGPEYLPENMAHNGDAVRVGDPVTLETLEREHIRKVLLHASTLQEAAGILGIDQATLWRKRKQFGVE
jgi:two-component system, NtrC family, response regulator AlgB